MKGSKIVKINDGQVSQLCVGGEDFQKSFAQLQMELDQYQREQAMKRVEELKKQSQKIEN